MLGSWVSEKIDQVYVRKKVTVKSNKIISITSFWLPRWDRAEWRVGRLLGWERNGGWGVGMGGRRIRQGQSQVFVF